jgi:hypothetical protein
MHYAYGDSSASPFTSNILEFLRDTLDFSVYVLEADQRIQSAQQRIEKLRQQTEIELEQIETLTKTVVATIEATPKGADDSPAVTCAERMSSACEEAALSTTNAVRQRLADQIAQAAAKEAAERDGCVNALVAVLAAHSPPESSSALRLRLREAGGYEALMKGAWRMVAVKWKCGLSIPEGHAFAQTLRLDNLYDSIEIAAPEVSGWLKKEVKTRPQRLEHHVITEVIREGSKISLRLRTEPQGDVGFDFESDTETARVSASRVLSEEHQLAAGPFELEPEDVPKVKDLCQAAHASLAGLKDTRDAEAILGDADFRTLPRFVDVVERFMGCLSPMVHEIAKHSLEPDELVLRRTLGNDRREEIFVSKTTLREKYEGLSNDLQTLFIPLGLHTPLSRSLMPSAELSPAEPATRSELPPSHPPIPPAKPVVPIAPPPPPMPKFGSPSGTNPGLGSVSALPVPSVRLGPNAPVRREEREELPVALKRMADVAKAGRHDEAFRECGLLLESPKFKDSSTNEQRNALRLLLAFDKPTKLGVPLEPMRRAYRLGRDHARVLVDRFADPADYELMGLFQLALDEAGAARETFRKGLELERDRSPESELCARLMRHAS